LVVPRRSSARQDAITAAARLFDRQGYHGTGIAQILAESGAPRGSFYFHFPGGKGELAVEAVRVAAAEVEHLLRAAAARHPRPGPMVRSVARALAQWLERSDYAEGCAVTAIALGAHRDDQLRSACRAAYASWQCLLAEHLVAAGVERDRAAALASLVVASLEGAVVISRTRRDPTALTEAADQLTPLFGPA
jgi:TetR/AcrR family transcriptional regulator, lmrAB and yxaGH operons repressor